MSGARLGDVERVTDEDPSVDFTDALELEAARIVDACVTCGACFKVCPTVEHAGLSGADPQDTIGGVLGLLSGGAGNDEAARFATTCMGSGFCIEACEHGINPRLMLSLARQKLDAREAREQRKAEVAGFRKVADGARVLSRVVATPDERARLSGRPADRPADIVFYTGCNVWKTPHIVLLCLDILDRLGVATAVMGGPENCCGVVHWRAGDTATAGRFSAASMERLGAEGVPILAWCPTCQVQFSEINIPTHARTGAPTPKMAPFLPWLADRIDDLAPHLKHPVRRRIGLHEHPGVKGVTEAAMALLAALPGAEIVDLDQPRDGWMCNTLSTLPQYKRESHASLLAAAADAGVDTLAGVYHACHRDLCAHETEWPFEVVNMMELIGEAMGISHEDRFKRLKALQDADRVMEAVAPIIDAQGLSAQDVRRVVERDLLGEQPLPLRGAS